MCFKPSITVQVRYKTDEEKKQIISTLNNLGWKLYLEHNMNGTSAYGFEWTKDSKPIYPKDIKYST